MNSRLKKCIAATLLLTSFMFAGCLQCDILLDIDQHGSGTIEAHYTISENAINQLQAMVELGKQLDELSGEKQKVPAKDPQILTFLIPEKEKLQALLNQYEKNGLKVDKIRVTSKNSSRTVDVRLKFEDISKVAEADFFKEIGFDLYKHRTGNYIFKRPSINKDNPDKKIVDSPEAQNMMAPLLEGFEVTVKIHAPGRIVESNAPSGGVGLYSATWIFNMEEDPMAFQKLHDQDFIMLIDGTGIDIADIRISDQDTKK